MNADLYSLFLAVAAATGPLIRAYFTASRETLSKQTLRDCLICGALGFLWNSPGSIPVLGIEWPLFDLPGKTIAQKTVWMAMLSYFGSDLVVNLLANKVPQWAGKLGLKESPPAQP